METLTNTLRKCHRCSQNKPREEFFLSRDGKRLFTPNCLECRNLPPVPHQEKLLRARFKRHGITKERFIELLELHNGNCHLCGELLPETRINVDHNHETGKVRGLLCSRCNSGIGFFHDDPEYMQKAINYVTRTAG